MSIEPFPNRGRGSNEIVGQPPPPNPPDMDDLVRRVTQLEARMGTLEKAVEGLKSLMDGFKDSLRAM